MSVVNGPQSRSMPRTPPAQLDTIYEEALGQLRIESGKVRGTRPLKAIHRWIREQECAAYRILQETVVVDPAVLAERIRFFSTAAERCLEGIDMKSACARELAESNGFVRAIIEAEKIKRQKADGRSLHDVVSESSVKQKYFPSDVIRLDVMLNGAKLLRSIGQIPQKVEIPAAAKPPATGAAIESVMKEAPRQLLEFVLLLDGLVKIGRPTGGFSGSLHVGKHLVSAYTGVLLRRDGNVAYDAFARDPLADAPLQKLFFDAYSAILPQSGQPDVPPREFFEERGYTFNGKLWDFIVAQAKLCGLRPIIEKARQTARSKDLVYPQNVSGENLPILGLRITLESPTHLGTENTRTGTKFTFPLANRAGPDPSYTVAMAGILVCLFKTEIEGAIGKVEKVKGKR